MKTLVSKSNTLTSELMDMFKSHIRVLHNLEDDIIAIYLEASIESIEAFSDIDINETVYTFSVLDGETVTNTAYTYFPVSPISSIVVKDSLDADVSSGYEIDINTGTIYTALQEGNTATVTTGYASKDLVPAKIKSIVFRYASHLYEHREAIQIGEPKHLPDWVNFALASLINPRV